MGALPVRTACPSNVSGDVEVIFRRERQTRQGASFGALKTHLRSRTERPEAIMETFVH